MIRSQRGNISFPTWELFVPSVENICFLPTLNHVVNTNDDEGHGENLSHIEWQTLFEGFLHLLEILDKEAESEDVSQTEAEIEAGAHALWHLLVEDNHQQKE